MRTQYNASPRGFHLPKYLPEPQAQRVIDVAAGLLPSARFPGAYRARFAVMATLYYTGIRRAECIGLDCEDVDFVANTIRVLGKGNKERLVPLHPDLAVILQAYLDERIAPSVGSPLFVSNQRRRISYETVQLWTKGLGRALGVPWLHPHVFRHTLATRVLRKSGNIRLLQTLLGHSDITSTMVYTHCDVSEVAEALMAAV